MFIAIIGTETLSKYGSAICTNLNLNYQLDPNLVRHAAEGSPPDCRSPPPTPPTPPPSNQNAKKIKNKNYMQVYQTYYMIHPSAESPTEID